MEKAQLRAFQQTASDELKAELQEQVQVQNCETEQDESAVADTVQEGIELAAKDLRVLRRSPFLLVLLLRLCERSRAKARLRSLRDRIAELRTDRASELRIPLAVQLDDVELL